MVNGLHEILIVDDDADLADASRTALECSGYSVRIACCREEALEEIAERKPDLLLLDVKMRQPLEGLYLAQDVRQNETTRDIPIIFLTGSRLSSGSERRFKNRVAAASEIVLEKPVNLEILLASIGETLGVAG